PAGERDPPRRGRRGMPPTTAATKGGDAGRGHAWGRKMPPARRFCQPGRSGGPGTRVLILPPLPLTLLSFPHLPFLLRTFRPELPHEALRARNGVEPGLARGLEEAQRQVFEQGALAESFQPLGKGRMPIQRMAEFRRAHVADELSRAAVVLKPCLERLGEG